MNRYLESTEYIDWKSPEVLSQAGKLAAGISEPEGVVRKCFEFVRDEIKHSLDFEMNPVTCKASDVLKHRTGFCYAKSHLLAALLRAHNIPAGLCYQRLSIDGDKPSFCIHGLNAVHLELYGWYRLDPRSNTDGLNGEFCPPVEKLPFSIVEAGEADLPEIWAEPLPIVVKALTEADTYQDVADNLPDVDLRKTGK